MIPGIRSEAEDDADEDSLEFDEFGFKLEFEDGPEQSSSKLLSTPFKDNPQQRLRWLAHLEFAQTSKKSPRKPPKCGATRDDSGDTGSRHDMTAGEKVEGREGRPYFFLF